MKGKYKKLNLIYAVCLVYRINRLIVNSKKIFIAILNGGVIGSAVLIVMTCDFRIASERAWLWLPDPQYGGMLADGEIDILQKCVGVSNAKRLCMTNERIDIGEAYRMGAIYQIAESENLREIADRFAENIAAYSYTTLRNTKAILNKRILKRFQLLKLLETVCSKELGKRLKNYRL